MNAIQVVVSPKTNNAVRELFPLIFENREKHLSILMCGSNTSKDILTEISKTLYIAVQHKHIDNDNDCYVFLSNGQFFLYSSLSKSIMDDVDAVILSVLGKSFVSISSYYTATDSGYHPFLNCAASLYAVFITDGQKNVSWADIDDSGDENEEVLFTRKCTSLLAVSRTYSASDRMFTKTVVDGAFGAIADIHYVLRRLGPLADVYIYSGILVELTIRDKFPRFSIVQCPSRDVNVIREALNANFRERSISIITPEEIVLNASDPNLDIFLVRQRVFPNETEICNLIHQDNALSLVGERGFRLPGRTEGFVTLIDTTASFGRLRNYNYLNISSLQLTGCQQHQRVIRPLDLIKGSTRDGILGALIYLQLERKNVVRRIVRLVEYLDLFDNLSMIQLHEGYIQAFANDAETTMTLGNLHEIYSRLTNSSTVSEMGFCSVCGLALFIYGMRELEMVSLVDRGEISDCKRLDDRSLDYSSVGNTSCTHSSDKVDFSEYLSIPSSKTTRRIMSPFTLIVLGNIRSIRRGVDRCFAFISHYHSSNDMCNKALTELSPLRPQVLPQIRLLYSMIEAGTTILSMPNMKIESYLRKRNKDSGLNNKNLLSMILVIGEFKTLTQDIAANPELYFYTIVHEKFARVILNAAVTLGGEESGDIEIPDVHPLLGKALEIDRSRQVVSETCRHFTAAEKGAALKVLFNVVKAPERRILVKSGEENRVAASNSAINDLMDAQARELGALGILPHVQLGMSREDYERVVVRNEKVSENSSDYSDTDSDFQYIQVGEEKSVDGDEQ